nr:redoxin domain-containing protein [Oceanobacter mangrovi]
MLLVLLITLASQWLSRHMLAKQSQIPDLSLTTLDGQTTSLYQQLAELPQQPTLVYLFAPWCSICKVSMPGLPLVTGTHTNLLTIGLSWQSRQEVAEMVQPMNLPDKPLLGDVNTAAKLAISGFPSYYLIDPQGRILTLDRGLTTPVGLWLKLRWQQLKSWWHK